MQRCQHQIGALQVAGAVEFGQRRTLQQREAVTVDRMQAVDADPMLRVVATFMNARSRWTGIATGDQAIFATRAAFEAAGGFPDIPLMEDVALSRALRRRSPPACLRSRVITSGRRWERGGTLRTILLMWRLRLAYALGADPHHLARRYGTGRTSA